jgi:hypothetical protein
MEAYRNKFIATGKFAPLKHFMVRAQRRARGIVRDANVRMNARAERRRRDDGARGRED